MKTQYHVGQEVIVRTGDYFIWRSSSFHQATILAQTEDQVKVLFVNKRFGIFPVTAWVSKLNVNPIL